MPRAKNDAARPLETVWEVPDAFWERAKTNLQAGKIRLVFLADEIPPELVRIVEFLGAGRG